MTKLRLSRHSEKFSISHIVLRNNIKILKSRGHIFFPCEYFVFGSGKSHCVCILGYEPRWIHYFITNSDCTDWCVFTRFKMQFYSFVQLINDWKIRQYFKSYNLNVFVLTTAKHVILLILLLYIHIRDAKHIILAPKYHKYQRSRTLCNKECKKITGHIRQNILQKTYYYISYKKYSKSRNIFLLISCMKYSK